MSFLQFFPAGAPTSSWPALIRERRKQYDRRAEKLWPGLNATEEASNREAEESSDDAAIKNSSPARESSSSPIAIGHHKRTQSRSIDMGRGAPASPGIGGRSASKSVDGDGRPNYNYFEQVMNFDLQQDIEKDVIRTHNKRAFFRHPTIRSMMSRILMVYAIEHPKVGYKQGMNDLVAAVLFLLYRERMKLEDDAEQSQGFEPARNAHDENLAVFLDFDFIEHDTYTLLSLMMQRMEAVFCPANDLSPAGSPTKAYNSQNSWLQRSPQTGAWDILSRLQWIQNIRLRVEDEELPVHLLKLGIHPHMYLLPWIRLLFSREYCMEGLWLLWDAIFALSPVDFSFANYISVAMIESAKTELLALNDMASTLLFLQRPQVRSIFEALKVIKRAKTLWDRDHSDSGKNATPTKKSLSSSPPPPVGKSLS